MKPMGSETELASHREQRLIALGAQAVGPYGRIEWREQRKAYPSRSCPLDCDFCWRSHLFAVGLAKESYRGL